MLTGVYTGGGDKHAVREQHNDSSANQEALNIYICMLFTILIKTECTGEREVVHKLVIAWRTMDCYIFCDGGASSELGWCQDKITRNFIKLVVPKFQLIT